ncbi:haloacid dehalogenase [Alloscardovia macacae]|uniref:Haloacid dehalogenase n=2 Tax=Alloscardovia macacae TaxID=1160091 RepID=A0A1Y2SXB4_9BIFI|nr:cation-translocating P-type ATPase [Alloscardovia macacae]OTA25978.1 haloacid dehalogenase [Alloscardovia macacae]OTA28745.1 haloacid dehalogenase [Alloscardovia macacae]
MTENVGVTHEQSQGSSATHAVHTTSAYGNPFGDADPSISEISTVEKAMNTSIEHGLSSAEAAARLTKFGRNELASKPKDPAWKRFLAQFQDPLVYLLLVATVISFVAWTIERSTNPADAEPLPFDCIVIVLILIVNAVLGYIQENRAEAAVEALAQMATPQTTVLRDGRVSSIATAEVVPGDVIILGEGDTISADGRLFEAASLRIAEASLTGESLPVAKKVAVLDSVKALGDRTNMVFNGTSITQGTGRAIVTSTGMNTQVGKIADMLSQTEEEATPLEKEMDNVSRILGVAVVLIAVVVLAALWLLEGFHSLDDVIESLLLAVSLAVAAVPEGLATILTVVLALGVQRMAKHNAIVKKLSSVETLGSASVICSDKTGTLTRNEMTVETVITPSGEVRVTGTGYAPVGMLVNVDGSEVTAQSHLRREVERALAAGALANNAQLQRGSSAGKDGADGAAKGGAAKDGTAKDGAGTWEIVGDPTEASVLVAARKAHALESYQSVERLAEIPFTSERKMQTVIVRNAADSAQLVAYAKGAPDVLLAHCSFIEVDGVIRPLTDEDRANVLAQVERLSSQAYRTLGQASRALNVTSLGDVPGIQKDASGHIEDIADQSELIEQDYVWLGMVGIIDPPRTEVRDSIAEAHRAGIRTIMITGDHPLTAARIASDLGIIRADGTDGAGSGLGSGADGADDAHGAEAGEPVSARFGNALTGDQLDAMSDEEFQAAVQQVSVYARVAPEHKMRIVNALQKQGNIVAMTGDGVNDAPAVKSADIGVAMGITGTEVTKQSAKMILADDNFSTIVAAVREGRVIFDNIRKFLRYLLSSNVGEVFTVFFGVVLAGVLGIKDPSSTGVTVPLLATQLLWINLLTDAAPALAMGVDGQTDDVMGRAPRKMTERVIDAAMWADIAFIGIVMAAVTLIGIDLYLPGGLVTDPAVLGVPHDEAIVQARTMGFTILVFAQLFNALASRSATQSAFSGLFTNMWLWGAMALSIVLQLFVIYVPVLNSAFGTTPLDAHQWLEAMGLAAAVLVLSELYKLVMRAVRGSKMQAK